MPNTIINTLPPSAQQQLEALVQRNLGDIFPACTLAVIKGEDGC